MVGRDEQDLPLAEPLTPREREVLDCIGEGMSNRQIAEHLTIAVSTVKWYVRQIYNKLGVANRVDAVSRAQNLGLLEEKREITVGHNLPVAATPFVGREKEMDQLATLIADPKVRIITIVGPGGIGKTRLAMEVTRRELHPQTDFPDGIFFVSLAPVNSAIGMVSTLASVLNFHFQDAGQGGQQESAQILNYLRQKQMLLILDNFEQIADGQPALAEFSGQAAGVKLLVTSRERLKMLGEQLLPLQGLELPTTSNASQETISANPAVQLFLNIARRTVPDFELQAGESEQLLQICQLVEGMPLGLELAASWAGLLPLSEIASELKQSLTLLSAEHHDVPKRHRSMQATLGTSWRRLNLEQQLCFQGLTVFRGGFTRETALEVAGATLPLLVTLINKSWISYDRETDRFIIHELLRQFGAEKLKADPELEQSLQERHSVYFCGYLNDRREGWFGPRQAGVAADIRGEIENIQAAWRFAAENGDIELLTQALDCLCHFYKWEGRIKDGRNACRLVISREMRSPNELPVDAERLALMSQALVCESDFVSNAAQKLELLEQSQRVLDRAGQTGQDTRAGEAQIYYAKAGIALNRNLEEAIDSANRSLLLFRELDHRVGEANALARLGYFHLNIGKTQLASELSRASLKIRQQMQDKLGIAQAKSFLGFAVRYQGKFKEAETLHRQCLRLVQQVQNRYLERTHLTSLSYTQSWSGNFISARETITQAIAIEKDLALFPNTWRLNALTLATIHLGNYGEALSLASESLQIARQRDLLSQAGWALWHMGSIAVANGSLARAREYLEESDKALVKLQHVHRALPWACLGYVHRGQSDERASNKFLERALRAGIEYQTVSPIIYCLPLAALLISDGGRPERAIELYGLAREFGHITNSRWFEEVAGHELEKVRSSLPPEVASAAEASGRELDIWHTANCLLDEFAAKSSL